MCILHAPPNFVADLSNIVWTTTTAGDANYPNAADGTVMIDHRKTYAGVPAGVRTSCAAMVMWNGVPSPPAECIGKR